MGLLHGRLRVIAQSAPHNHRVAVVAVAVVME
jgi:hypothetical protein